ncbi:ATP-binding protein [Streptomyces sp. NPDC050560]|uniref:ATP-binding protein n=1 Tax=Streptomyces sp. NPDC050560 TaxID=3365630 RepID=UPI0037A67FBF
MTPLLPERPTTARMFTQLLSATRRGARLARLLSVGELHRWGVAPSVTDRAGQVIAEMASNAVLHGRVRGRDFRIALVLDASELLIEVSDARGERQPVVRSAPCDEHGRGMLLVDALSDDWGASQRPPGGKTVWARLQLPNPPGPSPTRTNIARPG